MRLDIYLVKNSLARSRTFAKALIEGGFVAVNGVTVTRSSFFVDDGAAVDVCGTPYTYASRGGVKLEAALDSFGVDAAGAVCADIGASSGGFTDCLLQRGAARVYAIDSGSGQLAESLRNDTRVVNIENFNARALEASVLGELCDIAVCDVSFISQTLILPAARRVLKDGGIYIGLIKPQFECGREGLGKGGIVKDKKYIAAAAKKVIGCAAAEGLSPVGLIPSPISGGDGNRELLMMCRMGTDRHIDTEEIDKVVNSL